MLTSSCSTTRRPKSRSEARYKIGLLPFTSYTVVDGRLVTGQRRGSAKARQEGGLRSRRLTWPTTGLAFVASGRYAASDVLVQSSGTQRRRIYEAAAVLPLPVARAQAISSIR